MDGFLFSYFLIFVFPLALIINVIVAKKFEKIAIEKGYSYEMHVFAMCFFLGIVGYLYVIALPDHASVRQHCTYCKNLLPTDSKRCPICRMPRE